MTIVWVGLEGNEIVIGKLMVDQKIRNIRRDPRVSLSIEAEGDPYGMQHYLGVEVPPESTKAAASMASRISAVCSSARSGRP